MGAHQPAIFNHVKLRSDGFAVEMQMSTTVYRSRSSKTGRALQEVVRFLPSFGANLLSLVLFMMIWAFASDKNPLFPGPQKVI
jgi:hypothetical protein